MELKDIIEKLDLPASILEQENIEEGFVSAFKSKYVSKELAVNDKEIVGKIAGKILGSATTKLKQISGFTESDVKDKKLEEVIEMFGEKYTTEVSTLSEQLKKTNDEKAAAYTEEIEKLKKQANKYKTDFEKTASEYQQKQEEWQGQFKNYKIKSKFDSEFSGVRFKDDLKPIEREGFLTVINKKYQYDLDENDNLVVYNEKKEPIENPKKLGSYYTPKDVLELEAATNGLLKMNNATATTQPKPFTITSTKPEQPANGRKLAPAAQQHADALKS